MENRDFFIPLAFDAPVRGSTSECCSSTRRQHQIPQSPFVVGSGAVVLVRVVRDLGIYLDSDLMMRTHVAKTVSSCSAVLRQLRSIRRSVSDPVLKSLVVTLVLTKLDYGSATLAGRLPAVQLDRLQSVLNAAAQLIYRRWKFDRVTVAQGTALAASARAYHLPVGSSCLPTSA